MYDIGYLTLRVYIIIIVMILLESACLGLYDAALRYSFVPLIRLDLKLRVACG